MEKIIQLPKKGFAYEYIDKVQRACSKDKTRHSLSQMFLDPEGFMVSTDGTRMHILDLDAAVQIPDDLKKENLGWINGETARATMTKDGILIIRDGELPDKKEWRAHKVSYVKVNANEYMEEFDLLKKTLPLQGAALHHSLPEPISWKALQDLCNGTYKVMTIGEGRPVVFLDEFGFTAVIMPVSKMVVKESV
jgi:hypothetical protein